VKEVGLHIVPCTPCIREVIWLIMKDELPYY
jgi:hypothetical protein